MNNATSAWNKDKEILKQLQTIFEYTTGEEDYSIRGGSFNGVEVALLRFHDYRMSPNLANSHLAIARMEEYLHDIGIYWKVTWEWNDYDEDRRDEFFIQIAKPII